MSSCRLLSPIISAYKMCRINFSILSKSVDYVKTARLVRAMVSTVEHNLTLENMNPHVKVMEYTIRGPLTIRAIEIQEELAKGVQKPFTSVINANIGDCQATGQLPITFLRQLVALTVFPKLLEDPNFPDDAKSRAQKILKDCKGGSIGAYTESPGIEVIRRHVAKYIEKRDGRIPSNWKNIFLSSGASDGIKSLLNMINCGIRDGKKPGVMVPIPVYPLYSATLSEFNMHQIGYFLDEKNNWFLEVHELERAIAEAKEVSWPRAIVVINPGNPTGQVLSKENIKTIIEFAHKHKLFIIVDEVYQDNIYDANLKFHSFKKVMLGMGEPYSKMELASFMSVSKGYTGECGLRGGYMEVINMSAAVMAMYNKSISSLLCSNVPGQVAVDVVVNPPQEGDPSYELFMKEKTAILDSLALKAKMVTDTFNALEGISCNIVQGAMYAFPQITFSSKALAAASAANQEPEEFYAMQLLEETGICVLPGSAFGQLPGTYHFRTTILPQVDQLNVMLVEWAKFHKKFVAKHA